MTDLETRLARALRPVYRYRVVAGAAQFGNASGYTLRSASLLAAKVATANPWAGTIELERTLQLPTGGRRYWRMRGKRWAPYDATDAEERKPARSWSAIAAESKGGEES